MANVSSVAMLVHPMSITLRSRFPKLPYRRGAWAWSIRDLYDRSGVYRYYGGFNPAAVIATLAGAGFYLWTLNPWTWTSANGWFPYITAGVPSFVVAFVVYGVLMRFWIMRVSEPPSRSRAWLPE